jgi:fatty-acid peroxygenase
MEREVSGYVTRMPQRTPFVDRSLWLLAEGYRFLPNRRAKGSDVVVTRLLGQRAIGIGGPDAAELFYDSTRFERHSALPAPVIDTLFGRGAVHTLDDEAHRVRKAMFVAIGGPASAAALGAISAAHWSRAVERWSRESQITLFDEARTVLCESVCEWAGVPISPPDTSDFARDLSEMVDGFGGIAVRQVRARRARARSEARMMQLVDGVRAGSLQTADDSALAIVARHRDLEDRPLDTHTAAVEILNVLRPTVAVTWYVTFAAHALHGRPEMRDALRHGGDAELEWFVQEIRRSYPFAPYLGARVRTSFEWRATDFRRETWCCSMSTARCTTRRSGEIPTSSDRGGSPSDRSPCST